MGVIVEGDGQQRLLVDRNNPTGYTQVLEERRVATPGAAGAGALQRAYVVGADVLAQARTGVGLDALLTDGHGSTRGTLTDQLGVSDTPSYADLFTYTAYGR